MDKGLWISWYNLPENGRENYLSWVHGIYIPMLLKRPGFLWAAHYASVDKSKIIASRVAHPLHNTNDPSVPGGDRYILLFGAQHAHVFGDPVPSALHAGLTHENRSMLAMRIDERVNVMTEAARVEGPEANEYKHGMTLAPCIQLGSFNCGWRDEEEMLTWYAQWRMPEMSKLRGCIRTRRLASVAGWAKHAILYEFVSADIRNQYFPPHEDPHPDMKAWSTRLVGKLTHAPGSPNLANRIWPAVSI